MFPACCFGLGQCGLTPSFPFSVCPKVSTLSLVISCPACMLIPQTGLVAGREVCPQPALSSFPARVRLGHGPSLPLLSPPPQSWSEVGPLHLTAPTPAPPGSKRGLVVVPQSPSPWGFFSVPQTEWGPQRSPTTFFPHFPQLQSSKQGPQAARVTTQPSFTHLQVPPCDVWVSSRCLCVV